MFIVFLRFSANREQSSTFLEGHKAWLKRGFDEGIFLLAGTLQPMTGGCILAAGTSPEALRARVAEDPFVAEDVVIPEIVEMAPSMADDRLAFLKG